MAFIECKDYLIEIIEESKNMNLDCVSKACNIFIELYTETDIEIYKDISKDSLLNLLTSSNCEKEFRRSMEVISCLLKNDDMIVLKKTESLGTEKDIIYKSLFIDSGINGYKKFNEELYYKIY